MRVIAGKARSIPLTTPKGMRTRPTTDRIKETLFNMIQTQVAGSSFLDLFAGSGAIGIEALSRGAKSCVFVEKDRSTVSCIRENLKKTRLEEDAEILGMDVLSALQSLEGTTSFTCVFMDPPYQAEAEKQVLTYLAQSSLVTEDTLIIVEAALDTDFSFLEALPFAVIRQKRYKTNQHLFVQRKNEKEK